MRAGSGKPGWRYRSWDLGGFHAGVKRDLELGIGIVRAAVGEGITFLDNAWCYNGGVSESIMGRSLRDGYRYRVAPHARDGSLESYKTA